MQFVLSITKPLSVQLQQVGIDLMRAVYLVDDIVSCLEKKRNDDESFHAVWETAVSLADIAYMVLQQPHQAARQRNRVNI